MNPKQSDLARSGERGLPAKTTAHRALMLLLLLIFGSCSLLGQTFKILHTPSNADGFYYQTDLVLSGTTLYGSALAGGTNGGTVFRLNTDGTGFTVLLTCGYADGSSSPGPVLLSGTTLYGTGGGSVFRLNAGGGGYLPLVSRPNTYPHGLILGDSVLYCADYSVYGEIFRINLDGTGFLSLAQFGNTTSNPNSGMVLAGNTLYGTTQGTSSSSVYNGTVFKVNTDGTGFAVLKVFGTNGPGKPLSGLVLSGTTLYGTTSMDPGTVFKIETDGTGFAVLHNFDSFANGQQPLSRLTLYGNVLFGTTCLGGIATNYPTGTIFKLHKDGSGFAVLWRFSGSDGVQPQAGVVTDGARLYGTTSSTLTANGQGSGAGGTIFSLSLDPPSILSSPGDQTLGTGNTTSLSVTAAGCPYLGYQWCFNQTNLISGATNSSLSLTNLQSAQSGLYTAIVTNDFGSVTSAPARLQVLAMAANIIVQPTNCTAIVEASAAFSVAAGGSAPLSYQWYFNQTNLLTGADTITLQIGNVKFSDAGMYSVVVTNVFGAVTSSPAALLVIPHVTNVVTSLADSGSGSLRQAIANAAPADTIAFGVSGTITLATGELWIGKKLSILGPGASALTISGNRASRILTVGTNVDVLISDLALRDGQAPNGPTSGGPCGGGGPGQPGGAITNAGRLTLRNCTFLNNAAGAGGDGYPNSCGGAGGPGGAIYNVGTLWVTNCYFSRNKAGRGGLGTPPSNESYSGGAGGSGGAIYSVGTVCLAGSTFTNNSAGSGAYITNGVELIGSDGGAAGAIFSTGMLTASFSTFAHNSSGSGGHGWAHNDRGNPGGAGGNGGAIYGLGQVSLVSCLVTDNACGGGGHGGDTYWPIPPSFGGAGGQGGYGGGIYATTNLMLVGCTLSGNRTGPAGTNGYPGGGSGPGGSGGAVYSDGFLWMTNCTATGNWCTNGGSGGAIDCAYGTATVAVVCCTVVSNSVGTSGSGEGIYLPLYSSGLRPGGFLNNIIAAGITRTQDVCGAFNSLGHNLIGAANGSTGFTAAGDLVGSAAAPLDPIVGPLTDNGGPTLTMALLPGSPAIDAGSAQGAPTTDQRGVARPRQAPIDIGAFQYSFDIPELYVGQITPTGIQLLGAGKPTRSCRLLDSFDLGNWAPIATNQFGADGTILFQDSLSSSSRSRFYRLVTP